MRALVIHTHPVDDGYSAALFSTAVSALQGAGHEVRSHRLYQEGFAAAMSPAEHHAYHTDTPIISDEIQHHVDDLRWADLLVFVYPTWWGGLPALLKGWLERVMVPGVAFAFDEKSGKVKPNLGNIKHLVGITTYGSAHWSNWLTGDGGRRTTMRALRMLCPLRTRRHWFSLYKMDTCTDNDRAAFLERVATGMRAL
jgi:NAD(P)H dehydrogenase (quinone)